MSSPYNNNRPPPPPIKMRRHHDSPTRPSVLESNVDFPPPPPPLTVNGDVNRMNMSVGGGNNNPVNGNGTNKRSGSLPELDNDAESASPTDTMLTQSSKSRIPDDDDDPPLSHHLSHHHAHHHHHHHIRPSRVQRTAAKYGVTTQGLGLLICCGGMVLVLLVTLLSMVVMWPTDEQNRLQEVCLTPDCLRASAEVRMFSLRYNFLIICQRQGIQRPHSPGSQFMTPKNFNSYPDAIFKSYHKIRTWL